MGVEALLNQVMGNWIKEKRSALQPSGESGYIGHRREIIGLGFAEAELLVEYGHRDPTICIAEGESK